MLSITIDGVVSGAPRVHAMSGGGRYTTVRLSSVDRDGQRFRVNVSAVDETVAQSLSALAHGDPVSIVGDAALRLTIGKDGRQHVGLKVRASKVWRLGPTLARVPSGVPTVRVVRPPISPQLREPFKGVTTSGGDGDPLMGPSVEYSRAGNSTPAFSPVAGKEKGKRLLFELLGPL